MKRWLTLFMVSVILLSFTACYADEGSSSSALEPISIGVLPDVDSIPLIIADKNGYFKDEGVEVNIQQFKSAPDRDSALQSGKIDGAVSDILAAAFANDGGFNVKITSLTNGTYKLLVNKDKGISDVSALKDKSIAISTNTIIEYVTDKMLAEGGLKPEDVHKVAIPQIPTRLEMLQNGKIDAATLPDPLASVAVKNGAVLLNSTDKLNINPGVLLFTADAIDKKADSIEAMYRAYNKAVEYLGKEPVSSYVDVLINDVGFPEDIKDSISLPKYEKATLPSQEDFDGVITWLTDKKLIKNAYNFDQLVEKRFVR
ncbi:MetQ/NlpA family ABC transporter substrate-binding protein [Mahella sp.]|uniref:ABC transporter substrate-binding protein n=1 Tax=Mahella sp. TaxID=2798721 RepID=UPI0025C34F63|nr:MetQ/NlpA family ABC transporter substrate-binding protein [Mahella sp.]MBZ4665691.1 extracellular solute-binding protein family 3 [Mahella sp.]